MVDLAGGLTGDWVAGWLGGWLLLASHPSLSASGPPAIVPSCLTAVDRLPLLSHLSLGLTTHTHTHSHTGYKLCVFRILTPSGFSQQYVNADEDEDEAFPRCQYKEATGKGFCLTRVMHDAVGSHARVFETLSAPKPRGKNAARGWSGGAFVWALLLLLRLAGGGAGPLPFLAERARTSLGGREG